MTLDTPALYLLRISPFKSDSLLAAALIGGCLARHLPVWEDIGAGVHPVIDLPNLNCHITTMKFRTETVQMVLAAVQHYNWMVSVVLPSGPCPSPKPMVSLLWLGGLGASVLGTVLWTVYSSPGIHQDHGPSFSGVTKIEHPPLAISRQLASVLFRPFSDTYIRHSPHLSPDIFSFCSKTPGILSPRRLSPTSSGS